MKKNPKPTKFRMTKRLWFALSYLVIIPLVIILGIYITKYNNGKISPFKAEITEANSSAEEESHVHKMKGKDFDKFTFTFTCTSYREPASSTTVRFKAAASEEKVEQTLSKVTYQVVLGANWMGYLSSTSNTGTVKYSTNPESLTYSTTSISGMDQDFPKQVLWFVTVKRPTAYVFLSFSTTKNTNLTYHYLLSYSYDEFFGPGALGGLSK